MNMGPSVVVNKGGFFSAIVKGIFGTIITVIICGTLIAVYALNTVQDQAATVLMRAFDGAERVITMLPEWQRALPPQISEALDDHRAPDYRDQLTITTEAATESERRGHSRVVVTVANQGAETVSMLVLRVVTLDSKGAPVGEDSVYLATPVAFEGEWRGPILPGNTRRVAVAIRGSAERVQGIETELVDIRLWNREPKPVPAVAAFPTLSTLPVLPDQADVPAAP